MPFKVAFIGTHGVGKTTLAYGLASRLKRRDVNLEVVVEVARRCPLPLNEGTTLEAQAWILHAQIASPSCAAARRNRTAFGPPIRPSGDRSTTGCGRS